MSHTVDRGITQQAPPTLTDRRQPPRRSRRTTLTWVAVATGLVAAVVLVVLTITSDTAPPRTETDRTPAEVSGHAPQSADAAEHYLSQRSRAAQAPRSADAAERYLADQPAPGR
jgi:hypothetical protein